ncbi:hypothetical protein [Pseudomonas synxantha]|uniref:hypothetical protein n=1 Tax=Pseudomonas synxantha TaxID=47883 RepID=UPI0011E4CF9A|nr:hypothetical protein [Pseudomonas synxantha]
MALTNPNGTYEGAVYDPGERNAATLIISSSDTQAGRITKADMTYYGLNFNVTGTFTAQSFNLRAQAKNGDSILNITLNSSNDYQKLDGKVTVERGGTNVGRTYDMTFQKH